MPDIHVPKVDERGASHILKLLLEVALISVGVFLGLLGEQWRESRHHQELAEQAMRRFRAEIVSNRKAVADVKDYHVTLKKQLDAYLAASGDDRKNHPVRMVGVKPAFIETTAWELAVTTQALAYVNSDLAFKLSRMHLAEQVYLQMTQGMLQAMYLRPPAVGDPEPFFATLSIYFADTTGSEPRLLALYDDVLKDIDRELR
ncbi:MAG TPA: hypothetical protein VFA59_01435 [Vicinamibacterales bacterium]|nr:hypothetical protein [Vicinamibacterales bacterium]